MRGKGQPSSPAATTYLTPAAVERQIAVRSGVVEPSSGGKSVLSVRTTSQAPRGTYTLRITGSGGGCTRSTTVTLTIQ